MPQSSQIAWPTVSSIKTQLLEDVALQCIDAGVDSPPTNKGTHWDLWSTSTANVGMIQAFYVQEMDKDSDPTRAEGDALEEYRIRLGLPEVPASVASGVLTVTIVGTGVVPVGLQFTAPNGLRGKTLVSVTGTGAVQVDSEMLDTGEDGNLEAGTKVKFAAPPANVLTEASVYTDFEGGNDTESEAKKRERIINRLQNPPGGGNWSQVREIAMSASGAVSNAFCYPALGGPGSMKVVVLSGSDSSNREITSTTELNAIRAAIAAEFPDDADKYVVQSTANLATSVAIGLELPSTGSGAWLGTGPSTPSKRSGSGGSATNFYVVAVDGTTTTFDVQVGDTIAYWSRNDQRFYTAEVLTSTITYPGVIIQTGTWSDGGVGPISGEYISPAFDGIEEAGDAWVAAMLALGCGENIADTNARFNRAYRHPAPSVSTPHSLTSIQLSALQEAVPAITGAEYLLRSPVSTPTVPALLSDPPYTLTCQDLGFYPV